MTKKFVGAVAVAFAFAFAATIASAVSATAIYTPSTGYLQVGSGMGAKAYQAPNVVAAQTALNACVPGTMLVLDGKFGPLTKGKFVAFQASKNIAMDGIIGPITAGQLAACSGSQPTPDNNNNNSDLEGSFGTIDNVNNLSQYNNEEVGEGQNDVKVAGFEVEASNDGDIALSSMKVSFTLSNSSGSTRLDDYADRVVIMQGSDEIGSADAADFNKDSTGHYSKTITLDNSVVRANDTEKFYIALDAAGGFDSGDIDSETVSVDVENIRFHDGSGVVTTFVGNGTDYTALNVGISFVSFSSAADTKLKIMTDSSSPTAGIVMVSTTDNTDEVLLLKGKLKLEGDSDVTINSFPVTITADGSIATLVADAATSFKLVLDGEEYTESSTIASAAGTVTFDNGDVLDQTISAGDTVSFAIYADINDIQTDGVYPFNEGGALTASVTSSNRAMIDVENEEGDQLTDSTEKTGSVTGEAQEFRSSSATFTLVGTSFTAGTATSNNTGVFHIKFKVAAGDDPVYVSSVVANAVTYAVYSGSTTTTGGTSATLVNLTDGSVDVLGAINLNEVNPGQPETFDLAVAVTVPTAGPSGQFRLKLTGIKWGTDNTDSTPNNTYSSNLGSFDTGYEIIN